MDLRLQIQKQTIVFLMELTKLAQMILVSTKASCPDKRQLSKKAKINMRRKILSCFIGALIDWWMIIILISLLSKTKSQKRQQKTLAHLFQDLHNANLLFVNAWFSSLDVSELKRWKQRSNCSPGSYSSLTTHKFNFTHTFIYISLQILRW